MITEAIAIAPDVLMRPATLDDAGTLCQAYLHSREYLRPWEPRRSEVFFTPAGQHTRLRDLLAQRQAGQTMPWLLAGSAEIVGAVTLSNIAMGPFRSAHLGYWIGVDHAGRGLATAAVTHACRLADELIGLHRVEAGTVLDNKASQQVLAKCGFDPIGTAPNYLHIDGTWRDHHLFQKILNDRPPVL